MLSHLDDLAHAPHAQLAAFNAAEVRMLEGLEADDVELCGRYIMRGFVPGDEILGFVTRGQVRPGDPAESHPGIDIAVPAGTPVRAAGGGVVEAAGTDPAYGLFVLLRHSGGYETMYGHASRVLVRDGDSIQAGQVIALSGNSGRSTAPHLHFEIRREGKSIDPLTVVKQEN